MTQMQMQFCFHEEVVRKYLAVKRQPARAATNEAGRFAQSRLPQYKRRCVRPALEAMN